MVDQVAPEFVDRYIRDQTTTMTHDPSAIILAWPEVPVGSAAQAVQVRPEFTDLNTPLSDPLETA